MRGSGNTVARPSLRNVVRTRVPWILLLDVASVVYLTLALVVAGTGGFTVTLLGIRVAVHSVWRTLTIATVLAAIRVVLTRRRFWLLQFAFSGLVFQAVMLHYWPGTGVTSLIGFGEQFEERALEAVRETRPYVAQGVGYDGQFYAQVAVDPLLLDPAIGTALDDPGYRARRVLFPWLAWLLGLGRPFWVLQAFALLNVLAWLALACVLTRWLPAATGRGVALWFACLFSQGMAASLDRALLDGPSLFMTAVVVLAAERGRDWTAAGGLGLAGLGRETALLTGVALLRPGWWKRSHIGPPIGQIALAVVPLGLWLAYVKWGAGLDMSVGGSNFAVPFTAYLARWRVTVDGLMSDGFASVERLNLYGLISVTVQGTYLAVRRDWSSAWWRVGAANALLMTVLGWAVWEGYPGAYSRVALPTMVAFNVCLLRERRFWPLAILGNLSVISGLEILRAPWIYPHL